MSVTRCPELARWQRRERHIGCANGYHFEWNGTLLDKPMPRRRLQRYRSWRDHHSSNLDSLSIVTSLGYASAVISSLHLVAKGSA